MIYQTLMIPFLSTNSYDNLKYTLNHLINIFIDDL